MDDKSAFAAGSDLDIDPRFAARDLAANPVWRFGVSPIKLEFFPKLFKENLKAEVALGMSATLEPPIQ